MTPQQVNQVQTSFTKIVPIADKAAALFYGRLFEMAPETQALFCGDMNRQGWKLMSALATVVKGLRDFEAIVPIVAILRGVTSLMASSPSTMRWSGPPFCGPWNKGSAMNSPPRCARHGQRRIAPYRR